MWAIPTGTGWLLKKKKNYQVKSPSPESRVPETGSDPPIWSGRDLGVTGFHPKNGLHKCTKVRLSIWTLWICVSKTVGMV